MRRVINYLGLSMFVALALMGVAPLFLIIYDIYSRGIPAIIELGVEFLYRHPAIPLCR